MESCRDRDLVESHHTVGQLEQCGTMRDQHHGASAGDPANGVEDRALGVAVEVGGRLVEQQQRRVAHNRAGERDPLSLARGQSGSPVIVSRPWGSRSTTSESPAASIA
jgi:hypothetical protein